MNIMNMINKCKRKIRADEMNVINEQKKKEAIQL